MYLSSEREKLICPGKLPPSPIQTVNPLDPSIFPLSMALWFTSMALSLAAELALVKLPYLKLSELSSGS